MSIQNRIVNAFRRNPTKTVGRGRSTLRIAGIVGAMLFAVLMIPAFK